MQFSKDRDKSPLVVKIGAFMKGSGCVKSLVTSKLSDSDPELAESVATQRVASFDFLAASM